MGSIPSEASQLSYHPGLLAQPLL